jgi:16S rRNA (uracil1498-N3)-methyltransferase
LQLFYQPLVAKGVHQLDEEESMHAKKVLRLKSGTVIKVTDGLGKIYEARLTNTDGRSCEFSLLESEQVPSRNYKIHIAIAPTKNADRIEWFVEKAVELGIDKISFVLCKNSERKSINLERVEKKAISAMKQSGQAYLPAMQGIRPFQQIIAEADEAGKFIGFVDEQNPLLLKNLAKPSTSCLVLIGPEGDFAPEEMQTALQKGFAKVSLGSTRLRTETAGIAACHILNLINS